MTKLAENLARGRGVKRDELKSTYWYNEAAERRDPEAEYQIAMMHLKGKGGFARNDSVAVGWLRRAADHGHAEAQKELAKRKP
jgi:TPR repeat protein